MSTQVGGVTIGVGIHTKGLVDGLAKVDSGIKQFTRNMTQIRLDSAIRGNPFKQVNAYMKESTKELDSVFSAWSERIKYADTNMGKFATKTHISAKEIAESWNLITQKALDYTDSLKPQDTAIKNLKAKIIQLESAASQLSKRRINLFEGNKISGMALTENVKKIATSKILLELEETSPKIKSVIKEIETTFKTGFEASTVSARKALNKLSWTIQQELIASNKSIDATQKQRNEIVKKHDKDLAAQIEAMAPILKKAYIQNEAFTFRGKKEIAQDTNNAFAIRLKKIKEVILAEEQYRTNLKLGIDIDKNRLGLMQALQARESAGFKLSRAKAVELQNLVRAEKDRVAAVRLGLDATNKEAIQLREMILLENRRIRNFETSGAAARQKQQKLIRENTIELKKLNQEIKIGLNVEDNRVKTMQALQSRQKLGINLTEREILQLRKLEKQYTDVNKRQAAFGSPAWLAQRAVWFVQLRLFWDTWRGATKIMKDLIEMNDQLARAMRTARSEIMTTTEISERYVEAMKSVTISHGVEFKDVGEALYQLGSAGLSSEESLAALNSTMALIVGTEGDVRDVTKSIAGIYNNYANQITHVTTEQEKFQYINNMVAKTWKNHQVELSELTDGYKYAIATTKAAGLSFEELTALLAVSNDHMIKAGRAGRALNNVFMRISQQPVTFAKAFGLGKDVLDPNEPIKLMKIMTAIAKKLHSGSLAANELSVIFEKLGLRSAPQFITMLQNLDKVNNALEEGKDVTDEYTKLMEDRLDSIGKASKRLWNLIVKDVSSIFSPFLEGLKNLMNDIVNSSEALRKLKDEKDRFENRLKETETNTDPELKLNILLKKRTELLNEIEKANKSIANYSKEINEYQKYNIGGNFSQQTKIPLENLENQKQLLEDRLNLLNKVIALETEASTRQQNTIQNFKKQLSTLDTTKVSSTDMISDEEKLLKFKLKETTLEERLLFLKNKASELLKDTRANYEALLQRRKDGGITIDSKSIQIYLDALKDHEKLLSDIDKIEKELNAKKITQLKAIEQLNSVQKRQLDLVEKLLLSGKQDEKTRVKIKEVNEKQYQLTLKEIDAAEKREMISAKENEDAKETIRLKAEEKREAAFLNKILADRNALQKHYKQIEADKSIENESLEIRIKMLELQNKMLEKEGIENKDLETINKNLLEIHNTRKYIASTELSLMAERQRGRDKEIADLTAKLELLKQQRDALITPAKFTNTPSGPVVDTKTQDRLTSLNNLIIQLQTQINVLDSQSEVGKLKILEAQNKIKDANEEINLILQQRANIEANVAFENQKIVAQYDLQVDSLKDIYDANKRTFVENEKLLNIKKQIAQKELESLTAQLKVVQSHEKTENLLKQQNALIAQIRDKTREITGIEDELRSEMDTIYYLQKRINESGIDFKDTMQDVAYNIIEDMASAFSDLWSDMTINMFGFNDEVQDLKNSIHDLENERDQLENEGIFDQSDVDRLQQINDELDKMNDDLDKMTDPMEQIEEAFKEMIKSMIKEITAAITKILAMRLALSFLGGMGGDTGALTSLSEGGGTLSRAHGGLLPSNIKSFRKFSKGGMTNSPTMAILGDNPSKKELVIPSENISNNNVSGYVRDQDSNTQPLNIFNVISPADIAQAMSGAEGERIVLNHIGNDINNGGRLSKQLRI